MILNPKQQVQDLALLTKHGANVILPNEKPVAPIGFRAYMNGVSIHIYQGQVFLGKIAYNWGSDAVYIWYSDSGIGNYIARNTFFNYFRDASLKN